MIFAHGNHYHTPACKFFTVCCDDRCIEIRPHCKDDKRNARCPACKKAGALCSRPLEEKRNVATNDDYLGEAKAEAELEGNFADQNEELEIDDIDEHFEVVGAGIRLPVQAPLPPPRYQAAPNVEDTRRLRRRTQQRPPAPIPKNDAFGVPPPPPFLQVPSYLNENRK